jgi:hypothetical protein
MEEGSAFRTKFSNLTLGNFTAERKSIIHNSRSYPELCSGKKHTRKINNLKSGSSLFSLRVHELKHLSLRAYLERMVRKSL